MRMVLEPFPAPCRALVATHQAPSVFWRRLAQHVVPRVHFGTLKIDTQIDAENVLKNDSQIMRK